VFCIDNCTTRGSGFEPGAQLFKFVQLRKTFVFNFMSVLAGEKCARISTFEWRQLPDAGIMHQQQHHLGQL